VAVRRQRPRQRQHGAEVEAAAAPAVQRHAEAVLPPPGHREHSASFGPDEQRRRAPTNYGEREVVQQRTRSKVTVNE